MSDLPDSLRTALKTPLSTCYCRYNSDVALAQYCDAHYGPDKFGLENFSVRLVRLCLEALPELSKVSALDLGCAVGRSSLELARSFQKVLGVDYSTRFIELAKRLKKRGRIRYACFEEGELLREQEVNLDQLGLAPFAGRVRFEQGDAQELSEKLTGFDFVLAANLIDRLPDPGRFLAHIHTRLRSGGVLALASPYAWREEFTPSRKWLGGRFERGRPLKSSNEIAKRLAHNFESIGDALEIEFVIRETARYFQHGISQLTLWRKVH